MTALDEVLDQIEEYLERRQDTHLGPLPNEEMRLLTALREARLASSERDAALEDAAKEAEYECDRWRSSRDPLPDDVEGARSASTNIAIAIRALKDQK